MSLSHKIQHPHFAADSRVRWMLCHWPPLPQSALWHGHGLIYKPLSAGLSFFLVCELVGEQQKQRYRFRLRPLVACCPDCVHSVLTLLRRKWLQQKLDYYYWFWNMYEREGFFFSFRREYFCNPFSDVIFHWKCRGILWKLDTFWVCCQGLSKRTIQAQGTTNRESHKALTQCPLSLLPAAQE